MLRSFLSDHVARLVIAASFVVLAACGTRVSTDPATCKLHTLGMEGPGKPPLPAETARAVAVNGGFDLSLDSGRFGCERTPTASVVRNGAAITVTFGVTFALTHAKCGDCLYDVAAHVRGLPPGTYDVTVVREKGYLTPENRLHVGAVVVSS